MMCNGQLSWAKADDVSRFRALQHDPLTAPPRVKPERDSRTKTPGDGLRLVCAACGNAITTAGARMLIDGRHEHTFVNPVGYVYHIGCFAMAHGCRPMGSPSTEFAWFAGHSWLIELCGLCSTHLGWLFQSRERTFHGIILTRIVEEPGGAGSDH